MELHEQEVTPPVARNQSGRCSAIDGRTTRHAGYAMSLCLRKRIEEVFVRAKTVAGLSKRGSAACPSRLAIHSGKWPLLLVEAVS